MFCISIQKQEELLTEEYNLHIPCEAVLPSSGILAGVSAKQLDAAR